MSILVVGTVGYDTIEVGATTKSELLGGSAAYFALAASYFTPVSLVSAVGSDFRSEHRQLLAEHNIDLRGLEQREGPSFRWHGRYLPDLVRRETVSLTPGVFGSFRPRLLPDQQRANYLFLANLSPEMQAEVIDQMNQPRVVGAETISHWIAQRRLDLLRNLARVTIVILNEEEAAMLTGHHNPLKAGRELLRMGPARVLITRGEHGVMQFSAEGLFVAAAFPLEAVIDPTGAGDTFAGAFMGYLCRHSRSDETTCRCAVLYACVLASFVVEDFSLTPLLNLTWDRIDRRYREYLALTDQRHPRWISP
jgi:sugar/nucleoside kinase (ribokinase family)